MRADGKYESRGWTAKERDRKTAESSERPCARANTTFAGTGAHGDGRRERENRQQNAPMRADGKYESRGWTAKERDRNAAESSERPRLRANTTFAGTGAHGNGRRERETRQQNAPMRADEYNVRAGAHGEKAIRGGRKREQT